MFSFIETGIKVVSSFIETGITVVSNEFFGVHYLFHSDGSNIRCV